MANAPNLNIFETDASTNPASPATGIYTVMGVFPNGPVNSPDELFVTPDRFNLVYGYPGGAIPSDSNQMTQNVISCMKGLENGAKIRVVRLKPFLPEPPDAPEGATYFPNLGGTVLFKMESSDWETNTDPIILEFEASLEDGTTKTSTVTVPAGWTSITATTSFLAAIQSLVGSYGTVNYNSVPGFVIDSLPLLDFSVNVIAAPTAFTITAEYVSDMLLEQEDGLFAKLNATLKNPISLASTGVFRRLGIVIYPPANQYTPTGTIAITMIPEPGDDAGAFPISLETYPFSLDNLPEAIITINEESKYVEFTLESDSNSPIKPLSASPILAIRSFGNTFNPPGVAVKGEDFQLALVSLADYSDYTDLILASPDWYFDTDSLEEFQALYIAFQEYVENNNTITAHILHEEIDLPLDLSDFDMLKPIRSSFLALWSPRIQISHPTTLKSYILHTMGALLGVLALTDSPAWGPWYVPGGEQRGTISYASKVIPNFGSPSRKAEFNALANNQINVAIQQDGLVMLMGNYTRKPGIWQGQPESSLNFLNVRRFLNHLKTQLRPIFRKMLLEPNDVPLWYNTYLDLMPLMDGFVSKRAIYTWKYYGDQDAADINNLVVNNKLDVLAGKYKAKLEVEVIPGLLDISLEIIVSNGLVQING